MTTEQDNRNRLDQELGNLGEMLRQILINTPGFEQQVTRDCSRNLSIILQDDNWEDTFQEDMARCNVPFTHLDKVRNIRNDLAHHDAKYKDTEVTNQDIRAVQALGGKLHNFQSRVNISQPAGRRAPNKKRQTRASNTTHRQETRGIARSTRDEVRRPQVERTQRPQRGRKSVNQKQPVKRPAGQKTSDFPIQTAGIFFGTLIVATLIGNQFLPLDQGGTFGFIAALVIAAIALWRWGLK